MVQAKNDRPLEAQGLSESYQIWRRKLLPHYHDRTRRWEKERGSAEISSPRIASHGKDILGLWMEEEDTVPGTRLMPGTAEQHLKFLPLPFLQRPVSDVLS